MSQPLIRISNFRGGFATAYGRGKEPDDTFEDSRNLLPTKLGSLEQCHGYSTTGGLSGMPTGFVVPTADAASTYSMGSFLATPFPFSAELPASYDGRIYFFRDNQITPVDHYAINPWYRGASMDATSGGTTAQSVNSGFALLDQYKKFTGTGVTISAINTTSIITVPNATTHGLSSTADFYNGWRISFQDASFAGQYEYAYIVDYSVAADTATITVKENIGLIGLDWTVVANADTFTMVRWFHRPAETIMLPTFDSPPGRCFESEGRVRGSGGASSSQHKFPWWLGYIDRVFWTGHASAITYQGTYVDEMEMSQYATTGVVPANPPPDIIATGAAGYVDSDATGLQDFPTGRVYYAGWTLEYDGYQESRLGGFVSLGAVAVDIDKAFYSITITPSRMSKRVTALNIYVIEEVSGVQSQPYFVKRWDIVTPTTAELDATNGWIWTANNGTFGIDGGASTRLSFFTYNDVLLGSGQSYTSRTGRLPEIAPSSSNVPTETLHRHIVSWKEVEIVAGRALFGNYYDPNPGVAQTFVDQIRFTPITSTGIPNYDIIPRERDVYEKDVATGDPGIVRRLVEQNGNLIVFKDKGIYAIDITPFPETWSPRTVSLIDGLVSVDSVAKMPSGDIAFGDIDQFKIIRNQSVIPIVWNFQTDYFNLTKTSLVAWYDKIDRSIRFTDQQTVSSEFPVYCGYLDYAQVGDGGRLFVPFYKIRVPNVPQYVAVERDDSVLLTNSSLTKLYKWHKTDLLFDATTIKPYLKTHGKLLDEMMFLAMDMVQLTRYNSGSTGTLECKLYVDSASVTTTFATVSGASLANDTIFFKVRPTEKRLGRRVVFEYNTNASPETNGSANILIHQIAFHGHKVTPRRKTLSTSGLGT